MDTSASLTPDEVATLSDPERTWEEATHTLRQAQGASTVNDNDSNGTGDTALQRFAESLRLKNTLDAFEEKGMASVIAAQCKTHI
jgi:hypothetical protein